MRLRFEDLRAHLSRPLLPIYVLSGPEPLLLQEAADAVRRAAREQGYDERERLVVDPRFDWSTLDDAAASLSLFCSRRLIELHLGERKPGTHGAAALTRYADNPAPDSVLLVLCGQIDKKVEQSAWMRKLAAVGGWLQVWPVDRRQLPTWLQIRMRHVGLEPSRDAVELLAERVEGNLLAAHQEVEKLRVLNGAGPVNGDAVRAAVSDSARYDVYDLTAAGLTVDPGRVVRILECLREEGIDPTLVNWALARDVRALYGMRIAMDAGASRSDALRQFAQPKRRQDLLVRAIDRFDRPALSRLLSECARADRVIKGQDSGSPWQELLQLSLSLAGCEPLRGITTGSAR